MRHLHEDDIRLVAAGRLAGEDLLRADAHLAECADCRSRTLDETNADRTYLESVEDWIQAIEQRPMPLHQNLAHLESARETLECSTCVTTSKPLVVLRARIILAESWLHRATGSSTRALEIAREAKQISAAEGDHLQFARACIAESAILSDKGDGEAALIAAVVARETFERLGDIRRARIGLFAEAKANFSAGNAQAAAAILETLLGSDLSDSERASAQQGLAAVRGRLNDPSAVKVLLDAAEAAPAAVGIYPEMSLRIRWSRAILSAREGEIPEALTMLEELRREAAANGFVRDEFGIRCDMADALTMLGRHEEAMSHARAAFEYFAREGAQKYLQAVAQAIVRQDALKEYSDIYSDLSRLRAYAPELFPNPGTLLRDNES